MRNLVTGALAALLLVVPAAAVGGDYYTNVSGHAVHRPVHASHAPAGATARCRDGTWSFSEHHRGTCSHHGGVAVWLR
ncbi:MAG: DUF3761 domain-containing protein [Caulobacteraceae bacterium]|nr:DUF3761 domain-containing protein [Caulobacteraceae bacterium]